MTTAITSITLGALERSSESHHDAPTALREAVEALGVLAAQAAREGAFEAGAADWGGASLRVELVRRGEGILSGIIRRGVATGAFQPSCAAWAIRRLPHAILAGVCARWVFGLPERRSLRASIAADAALEVLRPRAFPSAHRVRR
jgi:hypothetical protein